MSWRNYRLEDVCKINIGKTPSRKNPKYWDKEKNGDNVWVSISDLSKVKDRSIGDSKEYISEEGAKLFKPVKKDTLLMSFKLSIGKLAFAKRDVYTNEAIAAFNINDDANLSSEFLFYYLTFFDWVNETKNDQKLLGRTLNKKKLSQIPISIPPLPVQKQIVEKLDVAFADIDKAISATEKNIENAEAMFKRYLDSIFEGDTKVDNYKKIIDVALIKGGKRVPKGYKLMKEKTEYPYIRVTDFNDEGGICDENLQYINEEIFSQIKNYTISSKDLYISIAGTIGKSGIVPEHLSGANLTENACKLVFKEETSNKFFYYFTKSSSFSFQAKEQTRVAGQPKLALIRLGEIMLNLPPLSEQEILLEKFNELERITLKLRETYECKISNLESLKTSILNQAFSGELTRDAA